MSKHINWTTKIDTIKEAVATSSSFSEVCRKLGRKPVGGSLTHVKHFCNLHGIDYSHMTGQGHNKGKPSNQRKSADSILTYNNLEGTLGSHPAQPFEIRLPGKLYCICPVCL